MRSVYAVAITLGTILFVVATQPAYGDIVIDVGPIYTPPGYGTLISSGTGAAFAGGRTRTFSGLNLAATANLYYGIKNDLDISGFSMDGTFIDGGEIFRFSSVSGNSIIYTGSTLMQFWNHPTFTSPTRLTLTFSGTGAIVQDAVTVGLSNAMADVGALWLAQSDFSVNLLVEATVPPFDANSGNYEPGNDLFNRLGDSFNSTGTSIDAGFYFENVAAVPEARTWLTMGVVALGAIGVSVLRRHRKLPSNS